MGPLIFALLHIHLHHQFHGPPFDYVGLAVAAAASWIGVPGPGEPVLIAAGVLAAKHKLDLGSGGDGRGDRRLGDRAQSGTGIPDRPRTAALDADQGGGAR